MNTGIVEAERQDYRVITGWVTEGASVLELGCGGGELLQMLNRQKRATVSGIEID